MSTKRHKQWWNDSDGLIPTPPRPSRLLLKEMHPQGSSHWSGQQVNPALVGDASLPWDDFPDLGIHAQPTSSATGFYLPLCRSSWEPIPVCVKLQHHVKCFICFLKSQLCFFLHCSKHQLQPPAPLFLHFTPGEYILAIPPGSGF